MACQGMRTLNRKVFELIVLLEHGGLLLRDSFTVGGLGVGGRLLRGCGGCHIAGVVVEDCGLGKCV